MVLHPPTKTRIRRHNQSGRNRQKIPPELRQAALEFVQRVKAQYGRLFASDRQLKHAVARLIESVLPPRRRRSGRPGYRLVTQAIRLRAKLRRAHPEMSPKEIWREIYRSLIPNYHNLPPVERRQAENRLNQRARWRLSARRRRRRSGKPQTELSVL